MKRRRMALFSIMAGMLFLAACATTGSGPGTSKSAIITVPECMTWTITVEAVRAAAKSVDGVLTISINVANGGVMISYDPQRTSPAKVAQVIRDKGFTVSDVKLLN